MESNFPITLTMNLPSREKSRGIRSHEIHVHSWTEAVAKYCPPAIASTPGLVPYSSLAEPLRIIMRIGALSQPR
jgi:hypothetical protein